MGTMLQAADPSLDDFEGYEGCNEILNVTRPDIVASVHDAYFEVGVDCVETNTFGANFANLAEYDIEDRIFELARAGARIARTSADAWSTQDRPRWVLATLRVSGRSRCQCGRRPSCRPVPSRSWSTVRIYFPPFSLCCLSGFPHLGPRKSW